MQQLSDARKAFDNDWAEIVGDLLAADDRVIVRMNGLALPPMVVEL